MPATADRGTFGSFRDIVSKVLVEKRWSSLGMERKLPGGSPRG
jgi:hypothetical protein